VVKRVLGAETDAEPPARTARVTTAAARYTWIAAGVLLAGFTAVSGAVRSAKRRY
jgi:hypothetical protein